MGKTMRVKIGSQLVDALDITLKEFAEDVDKALSTATKEAGNYAENRLQSTSPKRTGDYRASWDQQYKRGRNGYNLVVYSQAPEYRLTHLLEFGHQVRNKNGGPYGKARAIPHIEPVQKEAEAKLREAFERELRG